MIHNIVKWKNPNKTINVTGIVYYLNISSGNDSNDGLSIPFSWETADHADSVIANGDVVLDEITGSGPYPELPRIQDKDLFYKYKLDDIIYDSLQTPVITSLSDTTFYDGQSITVYGSGFKLSGATVELNTAADGSGTSVSQTVVSHNSTQISITIEQGALSLGTVYLIVHNTDGNQNSGYLSTLIAVPAGTNHYILDGGTGDGTAWNNALDALPATLVRGDTYYIGDGTYASYTFDDAVSGANYIYIKKATIANHGTETGWNDSYGDGQASFTGRWYFTRSYYDIDGQEGSGYSGHGFYVHQTDVTLKSIQFNGYTPNITTNYVIKHCEFEHAGVDLENGGNADCLYIYSDVSQWAEYFTFEDCAFHNATRSVLAARDTRNATFTRCYFYDMWNNTEVHAEAIAIQIYHGDTVTPQELNIRFTQCMFKNTGGAGTIIIGLQHGVDARINSNVTIDNSIFWQNSVYPERYYVTDGIIASLGDNTLQDCAVYSCTFINSQQASGAGARLFSSDVAGSGNEFRNNLVYNDNDITNSFYNINIITHNWYYHAGDHSAETSDQVGTGDPFTDYTNGDLTLSANTDAGYNLGSTYENDFSGNLRVTWSRGAYEFRDQIIADHTIVDDYVNIPDAYITEVKKMLMNVPGASHGCAYMYGLSLLEAVDSKFASNITWTGAPETYTADHVRGVRTFRWGTGWAVSGGEENWYTNTAGIAAMKAHLAYMRTTLSNPVSVFMLGWCWDMTWHNGVTASKDGVHGCGWAGSSVSGPEGDIAWGLDAADSAITGNSVCMDTYLDATEQYIEYDTLTKTIFTTGPVDENNGNTELGYQREVKQQYIRDYVLAHPEYALFDWADILYYNDSNEKSPALSWSGHTYYGIHTDNTGTFSMTGGVNCHIGEAGCLRLGKALWWMLARLAGWDGN
jgi:hypothetical protein